MIAPARGGATVQTAEAAGVESRLHRRAGDRRLTEHARDELASPVVGETRRTRLVRSLVLGGRDALERHLLENAPRIDLASAPPPERRDPFSCIRWHRRPCRGKQAGHAPPGGGLCTRLNRRPAALSGELARRGGEGERVLSVVAFVEGDSKDDRRVRAGERAGRAPAARERPRERARGDLFAGERATLDQREHTPGAPVAVGHDGDPGAVAVFAEQPDRDRSGAVGGERVPAQRIRARRNDERGLVPERVGDAGCPDVAHRPGQIGLDLGDVQRDVRRPGQSHGQQGVAVLLDATPQRVPEPGRGCASACGRVRGGQVPGDRHGPGTGVLDRVDQIQGAFGRRR